MGIQCLHQNVIVWAQVIKILRRQKQENNKNITRFGSIGERGNPQLEGG